MIIIKIIKLMLIKGFNLFEHRTLRGVNEKMMKKIAAILAAVGTVLATIGSQACTYLILDEPVCPKSLIK